MQRILDEAAVSQDWNQKSDAQTEDHLRNINQQQQLYHASSPSGIEQETREPATKAPDQPICNCRRHISSSRPDTLDENNLLSSGGEINADEATLMCEQKYSS